jgi:tetratricopeptide (TPR) repeat protein
MSRKSSKSIAIALQIVLGIVLAAILGMLSGLLTLYQPLADWVNKSHHSLPVLLLSLTAVLAAMIAVAIWQSSSSKDEKEPLTREDLNAEMRKAIEAGYDLARREGRIPAQSEIDKDAEINRLAQELQKLQREVAARSSEPSEAELEKLLKVGDLDGALRLKSQQVEARRKRLSRDLYELGTIHELRFEWPQSLAAFREAWEIGHELEQGFKYADFAAKLNHFPEAIATYEELLRIYTDTFGRAKTLNNLGELYRATHRTKEAEQVYTEALAIFRALDEVDPGAYLSYVAGTLDNLAIIYHITQRVPEAAQAFKEALAIYRKLAATNPEEYLADVSMALGNVANFFSRTHRPEEAEKAYTESLGIRRKLAGTDPKAYLRDVGTTLNNMASFYTETERFGEAERACTEALDIRRGLAKANPDAHSHEVAMTLNNLGQICLVTGRAGEAEKAYSEAIAICQKLAQANADAWLPYVAMTVSNLALVFLIAGRLEEAEVQAREAEEILEPFWRAGPELHGNLMASILGARARIAEARQHVLEPCVLARRALAAAYDPVLKKQIQSDIERLCRGPAG